MCFLAVRVERAARVENFDEILIQFDNVAVEGVRTEDRGREAERRNDSDTSVGFRVFCSSVADRNKTPKLPQPMRVREL